MKRIISIVLAIIMAMGISFRAKGSPENVKPEKLLLPSFINPNEPQTERHIERLSKYNNSKDTVGFLNDDGTETAYIFHENVRYDDENGVIFDKDNSIIPISDSKKKSNGFDYENKANDIKLYFDNNLNENGIQVNYQNTEINIKPLFAETNIYTSVSNTDENSSITYEQAFGYNTSLVLYTTYSGFKEDIVLKEYTGQNIFKFIVDFGNLYPEIENRGILLKNDDGSAILQIPPVFVEDSSSEFDNSRHFTMDNDMQLEKNEDGTYILSIIADKSFLQDKNTVYPVKIDPTVTIASSSFADAPVYSKVTTPYGAEIRNCVGTDSAVGTGYFYTSFNLSSISSVRYDNVLSAYYRCRELTGSSTNSVVECYLVNQSWSESSVIWSNKPGFESQKLCAVNVKQGEHNGGSDYWYHFYITMAVQAWRQGAPNYGIMFKERTNSSWKAFGSKEYSTYLPSLSVTYISDSPVDYGEGVANNRRYRLRNKHSGMYLTATGTGSGANVNQQTYNGSSNQQWRINYTNSGYCTLTPQNATSMALDLYCGANPPTGNTNGANIQIYTKNSSATNHQWKFIRNWDGSYRVMSRHCSDARGVVVQNASTSSGANVFLYTVDNGYTKNDYWTLEPVDKGDADIYAFSNSGGYGIDTTTYIDQAANLTAQMGFSSYYLTDYSAEFAYNYLPSDGIWYFTGHGYNSGVVFNSRVESSWQRSYIGAAGANTSASFHVNQFGKNALNKLNLAVFSSCYSGNDNGISNDECNLVGITYKRGAHFVIAHPQYTMTGADADWMIRFFTSLGNGNTIYTAMNDADNFLYANHGAVYGNLNERHVIGDFDLILSH